MRSLTFPIITRGEKRYSLSSDRTENTLNMPSRKRIPEETKATITALKATKDLTLEEIERKSMEKKIRRSYAGMPS